jgi:hypothetical protein
VAKGPYVELFIPYRARQAAPALRQACPEAVEQAAQEGGNARPALDCLAKLLDLRLDGAPLPVRLEATTDAASGTRGALAMIPAQALAAGRHVITLQMPRVTREGDTRPVKLQRIPFWR